MLTMLREERKESSSSLNRKDAVAAACGQAAGEDFEGALTVGCAGGECRLEHGQFVVVGEKGGSSHVFIVVGD